MGARAPTDFTQYISTSKVATRQPITITTLDNILNDQQLAYTRGNIIACKPYAFNILAQSSGAGNKNGVWVPSLNAKINSSGTCAVRVYAYITAPNPATFWVGVRAVHGAGASYSSVAIGSGAATWIDFGSDVTFNLGGDLFVGVEGSNVNHVLLLGFVAFAQPG